MEKYCVPYFVQHSSPNSLLILDNYGSHTCNEVTSAFEAQKRDYLHLAPSITPICQPIDIGVGSVIKGKIKKYHDEWVLNSWECDENL